MTEYTLAQVIDKFGRNRNLKFEYSGEESDVINFGVNIHLSEDGHVVNEEGKSILSGFTLGSRFRLVNEPVDRMMAFKAFSEGKVIYCIYEGKTYSYNPGISSSSKLMDDNYNAISAEEILYGKWFIREEN